MGRRGAIATLIVLCVAVTGWLLLRPSEDQPSRSRAGNIALTGPRGAAGTPSWTPWPQALHDAQHSGASTSTGPTTGRVRWSRRLEGNVTPGPVVAQDGTIYAASNGGVLHALDPRTGQDRWTVDGGGSYGSDLSTSPAVLPDGTILWPGPDSTLWAVSPVGRVLWRLRLDQQVTSPAVTAHGEVVVGDLGGRLMALRPTPRSPGVQWQVELGAATYGSPVWAPDGRTVYQSLTTGVVAVREGRVLWRSTPASEIIEVSPAVAPDGTVVVGTNDPYEYGLDPADGNVRWRHRRGYWTYSSPGVTRDGLAYFGDHHNRITGVDVGTGRVRFSFLGTQTDDNPGGVGIWTSVLVDARHSVYVGTRQGLVYGVDRTGRLLWQVETGATVDSYPALTSDGALVIGVSDGRLLAIADD